MDNAIAVIQLGKIFHPAGPAKQSEGYPPTELIRRALNAFAQSFIHPTNLEAKRCEIIYENNSE